MLSGFLNSNEMYIREWCEANDYRCWPGIDQDWVYINSKIDELLKAGWANIDVYRYIRCTEEIDPRLPETKALDIMANISKPYI
jgi:hypothetical protein